MTRQVLVDADALNELLSALLAPGPMIRELQATKDLPAMEGMRPNPIQVLRRQYNEARSHNFGDFRSEEIGCLKEELRTTRGQLERAIKPKVNEGYPTDWARLVLMVSPIGEYHAVGGECVEGEGEVRYVGLERLQKSFLAPSVPAADREAGSAPEAFVTGVTIGATQPVISTKSPLSLYPYSGCAPLAYPTPDPKYVIINHRLCVAATREPIPLDEPMFSFRGKDIHLPYVLQFYTSLLKNSLHYQIVQQYERVVQNWQWNHVQLVKEPDTVPY